MRKHFSERVWGAGTAAQGWGSHLGVLKSRRDVALRSGQWAHDADGWM